MITVGLTAYNSAATIERAVVSALNQTWRPIEIVAIDDCSTDNTASIISRIADSHPELRMFRNHKNLGVAATRNRVLAEAKGAFIAFFDDDDESLPQRLSIQLRRILDYERNFFDLYNHELIDIHRIHTEIMEAHANYLLAMIEEFVAETGSRWGRSLLENFDDIVRKFWLAKPKATELGSLLNTLRQAA